MDRPLDGLSNQGGNPNNPRGGGRGRGRGRGRGNYYQNQRTVEGYPQQAQYEQQPPQQQVQYDNRAMDNVFGGGLSVQVPLDGRTGRQVTLGGVPDNSNQMQQQGGYVRRGGRGGTRGIRGGPRGGGLQQPRGPMQQGGGSDDGRMMMAPPMDDYADPALQQGASRSSVFSRLGPRRQESLSAMDEAMALPIQLQDPMNPVAGKRLRQRSQSPYGGSVEGNVGIKRARYSPPPQTVTRPYGRSPSVAGSGVGAYDGRPAAIDTHTHMPRHPQSNISPRLHQPMDALPQDEYDVNGYRAAGQERFVAQQPAYEDRSRAAGGYAPRPAAGYDEYDHRGQQSVSEYDNRGRPADVRSGPGPAPRKQSPLRIDLATLRSQRQTSPENRVVRDRSRDARPFNDDRGVGRMPDDRFDDRDRRPGGPGARQQQQQQPARGRQMSPAPRGRSLSPGGYLSSPVQRLSPAQKPTLPRGWEMFETDDGDQYYHNKATGQTTWDRPVAPQPTPPAQRIQTPVDRNPRERLDRDRAPMDRDRAPMDRERAPMDRDRAPVDRERPLMVRERAPIDRERAPMDRERPPMDRERAPIQRQPLPHQHQQMPQHLQQQKDRGYNERYQDRGAQAPALYNRDNRMGPGPQRFDQRPTLTLAELRASASHPAATAAPESEEGEILDTDAKFRNQAGGPQLRRDPAGAMPQGAASPLQQPLQQRSRAPLPPVQVPANWRPGGQGQQSPITPVANRGGLAGMMGQRGGYQQQMQSRQPLQGQQGMNMGMNMRGQQTMRGQNKFEDRRGGGPNNRAGMQQNRGWQQQNRYNQDQQVQRVDGWAQNQHARWQEQQLARATEEANAEVKEEEGATKDEAQLDERLASIDPRDLLAQIMANQPAQPSLRQKLRGLAPLLPRSSSVLRAIRKLGILDRVERTTEPVTVLDANTEWDLRRRIAGSRRLGRVEFTGMSPSWSVLIEDAIEPPKFAPDISDALKEEVRKVAEHVPEGWYVTASGFLARKVFGRSVVADESVVKAEESVPMEVSA